MTDATKTAAAERVTYPMITRLMEAIEGELDGLAIDAGQALAILAHTIGEEVPFAKVGTSALQVHMTVPELTEEQLQSIRELVENAPPGRIEAMPEPQRHLTRAARDFMELFVVDERGLSIDHIDMVELTHRYAALEAALTTAADEEYTETCGVCSEVFKLGDICATDIELGQSHAECLAGCPTVDLETGEEIDGPITHYPYEPDPESTQGRAVLVKSEGSAND